MLIEQTLDKLNTMKLGAMAASTATIKMRIYRQSG